MLAEDNPLLIEERKEVAKFRKKCSECGDKLEDQADGLIQDYINKMAGNTNYVKYLKQPGNYTISRSKCLRIDFQASGADLNNIQMQLGGRCRGPNERKTTIATILIEGPTLGCCGKKSYSEIGYNKEKVKLAFRNSFNSWQNGGDSGIRIRPRNTPGWQPLNFEWNAF